jgi:hypothetical protein
VHGLRRCGFEDFFLIGVASFMTLTCTLRGVDDGAEMSVDATVDAAEGGALGVNFGGSERGTGKGVKPDLGPESGYLIIAEGVDTMPIRFLAGVCMR